MMTSVSEVINGLPLKQNSKILIIGDLSLRYLDIFSNKTKDNVTVLKINKKASNKISTVKEIYYDIDNGKSLPFRDSIYDVVFLAHSLRYIIYRESFLKDCVRVLKAGGLMVLLESKPDAFGTSAHPDTKIIFDDMLEYLDRAGFLLGENFETNSHEYGIISVCPLHDL